jgi:Luciferase
MSIDADERAERIRREVTAWPGVTTAVGEYGETDFVLGRRSIGHVHGGHQADIPFPRRIRDELVAAGRTGPHHVHPDSGWTTLYIRTDGDAGEALELLRINYDRITQRAAASARGRSVIASGRPAAGG